MKEKTPFSHAIDQAILQIWKAGNSFRLVELYEIVNALTPQDRMLVDKCLQKVVKSRLFKREVIWVNAKTRIFRYVPYRKALEREQNSQAYFVARVDRRDTRYNGNRNRLRGVL